MANITVTEVGDSIPTIVAAEALGYLKSNTVLARLVARDWDNEVAQYGQTVHVTYRGALSVNPKSANTVITLQAPDDDKYVVTLNKHNEVSFIIEDLAKLLARPEVLNGYIEDGMAKLVEAIDGDLAGLYSGLSQTISAVGGLTEANIRNSRRLLNAAKAPLSNRYAVLHEDADYEALGIEKLINRDYADSLGVAASDAMIGRAMGFTFFMDQNIKVAAAQCKNLFFQRNALVLATRPLPAAPDGMGVRQVVMNEDGVGLRVTMSYDHDYLGWKVTIDTLYGVAELRDNHGIAVSTTEI